MQTKSNTKNQLQKTVITLELEKNELLKKVNQMLEIKKECELAKISSTFRQKNWKRLIFLVNMLIPNSK